VRVLKRTSSKILLNDVNRLQHSPITRLLMNYTEISMQFVSSYKIISVFFLLFQERISSVTLEN